MGEPRLAAPSDLWGLGGSADSLGPRYFLGSAPLMAAPQSPHLEGGAAGGFSRTGGVPGLGQAQGLVWSRSPMARPACPPAG